MVESSEKARKEEDLRDDKQDHTISEALLDRGCMVALKCAFSDNVSSSLVYCESGEEESEVYQDYRIVVKSNSYAGC